MGYIYRKLEKAEVERWTHTHTQTHIGVSSEESRNDGGGDGLLSEEFA
jgi:hypothetical protein